MNGLSYSTDRWYFAVLLFLILSALISMESVILLDKMQIVLFEIVSGGLLLINIFLCGLDIGVFFRSIVLLGVALVLPIAWNHPKRDKYLLIIFCMTIISNGIFVFGHALIGGSGYSWGFLPRKAALENMKESISNVELGKGDGFERLDIYDSSLAASLVMDYCGTTEYFSILNAYISEFYCSLFISPGVRSAAHILKGLDGREELLTLLSVSQYTDFRMGRDGIESYVKENENYLPLGFTYKEWINREKFDSLNPIEKESLMLNTVVLEKSVNGIPMSENVFSEVDREINYEIDLKNVEYDEEHFSVEPGSRIRVTLKQRADANAVYVQFKDFIVYEEGTHEFWVGNKNLQLRSRDYAYYMGQDEFWVYVTELHEENGRQYFELAFDQENTFSLQEIKVYEHEMNISDVEKRKEHILENVTVGVNTIEGILEIEQEELLFLSVPYSRGWKAYVDGKEIEIYKANIAFMALDIPGGVHSIYLKYETPGLKVGAAISGVCMILLIILLGLRRKNLR